MLLTRFSLCAAALVLAVGSAPAPSVAASGLAFDSVTRFAAGDDAPPGPGNFQADFQAADNPPETNTPKMPFGLGRSMGQMQAAMQMFRSGMAERHYDAGPMHRVDHLAQNTAEITDCSARTLTTLNLKDKTYTVVSLDHPESMPHGGPSGPGTSGAAPSDDGSKMSIALTTRSLGDKNLDGTPTSGYDSDVKTTVTKANGDMQSFNMETTAYYAGMSQPAESCSGLMRGPSAMGPGGAMASMAHYQTAMRALRNAKGDPRISVSASGPALPSGKLALYELVATKGERGGSFNIIIERGNVRSIGETDSVFSVPAEFTKLSS